MHSPHMSMRRRMSSFDAPGRSSRSTRRRRSWSGSSRKQGASGSRRGNPSNPWSTTSPRVRRAKRFPTASMTWAATKLGSVSDAATTPLHSRVASLRRWWEEMDRRRSPKARGLFITADAGASNGYRSRMYKHQLQRFADETRMRIHPNDASLSCERARPSLECRALRADRHVCVFLTRVKMTHTPDRRLWRRDAHREGLRVRSTSR